MMPPCSLPLPSGRYDDDTFRDDLLNFACEHDLWQILCGGVHMLDFLVREPDLYESILPEDWREWLGKVDILDVIDLLNRESVEELRRQACTDSDGNWRSYGKPPFSLTAYILSIRGYLFDRSFYDWKSRPKHGRIKPLSKRLSTGMNRKKCHEVEHFSAFVNDLCDEIVETSSYQITDVVDFGAGQGYLGRSLASPLYKIDVVAVESKPHNIDGAKKGDILAKLSRQEAIHRNKKLFRAGVDAEELARVERLHRTRTESSSETRADRVSTEIKTSGIVRHIEHIITSGDITPVIDKLKFAKTFADENFSTTAKECEPQLMVISLHSCGNLLHHGLRSLTSNDSVKAVAMIGCCYNLCTERLRGPTFKLPNLRYRIQNKRLLETSNACDADGFPMSEHFAKYKYTGGTGVKLNITARMMAVQAPRNWTEEESDDFFTRHWYRALLQRIFHEHGIVPIVDCRDTVETNTSNEFGARPQPITIGRLSKSCFKSFTAYVRGALSKLTSEEARGDVFTTLNQAITDDDITDFEERFRHRRPELCVLWSLMAFSAGVVETMIITDRWQWLREQNDVARAWVQPVFEYSKSPRNLAIIGIKT